MIWAQDLSRAVAFYRQVFQAEVVRESNVMAELVIAGAILGIHGGGQGQRTWTGLNFQVDDLFAACDALTAAGGEVLRPPVDTPEEPAHLAMCVDPDGNEIMITRRR
ncbi:MAG TPA: VOC family protein [Chthoniobacterales bacterium]|nr:VOC family protein [Chthoniobacterales bacterium]